MSSADQFVTDKIQKATEASPLVAMYHRLSPEGLAAFHKSRTDEAYLDAYSEFSTSTEEALSAELPVGKPRSTLDFKAVVVRLSKRLEVLAEAFFDGFARRVGELVKEGLPSDWDSEIRSKWCQAVIQGRFLEISRTVAAVWTSWLSYIREISGGAVYGEPLRSIEDPESLTLKAQERRMHSMRFQVAERYSIPSHLIVRADEDRDMARASRESLARRLYDRSDKNDREGASLSTLATTQAAGPATNADRREQSQGVDPIFDSAGRSGGKAAGSLDTGLRDASPLSTSDVKLDEQGWYAYGLLAETFGLGKDALRKRLDRYREHNLDGTKENDNRRPREAKYLYRLKDVKGVIEKLRASSERPAK